MEWTK